MAWLIFGKDCEDFGIKELFLQLPLTKSRNNPQSDLSSSFIQTLMLCWMYWASICGVLCSPVKPVSELLLFPLCRCSGLHCKGGLWSSVWLDCLQDQRATGWKCGSWGGTEGDRWVLLALLLFWSRMCVPQPQQGAGKAWGFTELACWGALSKVWSCWRWESEAWSL